MGARRRVRDAWLTPHIRAPVMAQGLRHPWDGHGHGGGHGHGDHGHGGGHAPVSGYKYEGGPGGRIVSADDDADEDDEVEDAHADGEDGEDEDEDDE